METTPVNEMTMGDIVEEFNELAPTVGINPVKKFESRRVATRRLLNVRKQAATAETLHGYRGSMASGEVEGGQVDEPVKDATSPDERERVETGTEERLKTTRGRPPTYKKTDRVFLEVDRNPKRHGTKARRRFETYFGLADRPTGATIEELTRAGVDRADIKYDVKKGFITVRSGES